MVFRGDPIGVRVNDGDTDGTGDNGGVCHWDKTANMYHDVKDFCWLRTGVPSPNFTIVQNRVNSSEEISNSVDGGADLDCAGRGQDINANDAANTNDDDDDDDDDGDASSSDEDEL